MSRRVIGRTRGLSLLAALLLAGAVLWLLTGAGHALVIARSIQRPEAVIVLASHEWERLPAAADVARASGARVLLTMPLHATPQNCHRCATRVEWLQQLGLPATRISLLPRRVTNTYDEAVAAREFCEQHLLGSVLVVTSPYHTRRALGTFEAVFEGTPIHVGVHPSTSHSRVHPDQWWRHAYDRWYVTYEWAAIAWYAVRHGIVPLARGLPREPPLQHDSRITQSVGGATRQPCGTVGPEQNRRACFGMACWSAAKAEMFGSSRFCGAPYGSALREWIAAPIVTGTLAGAPAAAFRKLLAVAV